MAILKRIGVLSLAKFEAVFMAFIGLVMGIFYALFGAIVGAMFDSPGMAAGLGVLGIVVLPILYGILGFIGGALFAWGYNFIARIAGGIEMELE
jgi:hypothetical protein